MDPVTSNVQHEVRDGVYTLVCRSVYLVEHDPEELMLVVVAQHHVEHRATSTVDASTSIHLMSIRSMLSPSVPVTSSRGILVVMLCTPPTPIGSRSYCIMERYSITGAIH